MYKSVDNSRNFNYVLYEAAPNNLITHLATRLNKDKAADIWVLTKNGKLVPPVIMKLKDLEDEYASLVVSGAIKHLIIM